MKKNIEKIIDKACEIWEVERKDILKDNRKQTLIFARAVISYNLFNLLHLSLSEIGRNLNRSHSSISHHLKIYKTEYQYNKEFRIFANAMNDIVLEIKTDFQRELEDELKGIIG